MSNFCQGIARGRTSLLAFWRSCPVFYAGFSERTSRASESLKGSGCFSRDQHWRHCCEERSMKRFFHSSTVKHLQLENGLTHETWNEKFWALRAEQKKFTVSSAKIPISNRLLTEVFRPSKHLNCFRGYYFVLVEKGGKLIVPDEEEAQLEHFKLPEVIATTRLIWRADNTPIVIENRWLSTEEWETLLSPLLKRYTRNICLSGIMEFILLRSPQDFKIDERVNRDDQLISPVVESFLDFLFAERNIECCERSLVPYLLACKSCDRFDLVERVYGRARPLVKHFGPVVMAMLLDLLSDTKWWKDAYMFCDLLKARETVPDRILDHKISITALKNDDFETAFGLAGDVLRLNMKTNSPQVSSFLRVMLSKFRYSEDPEIWKSNRELVEGYLMFLASNDVFPWGTLTAQSIVEWFTGIKDENWQHAHFLSKDITFNKCPITGTRLKKKVLTDEEYDYLIRVVLKHVLLRKPEESTASNTYSLREEYVNAAKQEFKSFLSTIYDNGPFDIVIDGMNMFYQIQGRITDTRNVTPSDLTSAWLHQYVRHLERKTGRRLNVLVTFRQHLKRHVQKRLDDIATVYFSGNETNDDPFFVYAALLSGKHCRLLTLDCLRDIHAIIGTRFDYRTAKLLYKWQQIHQELVILKPMPNKKPQSFDVAIQRSENTWHIPYYDGNKLHIPDKWLVLKRLT